MQSSIPLIILALSILAFIRLIVWLKKGAGHRKTRIVIIAAFGLLQVYAWVMIWVFGAFHPMGIWSMGLCFVTAIAAFIIPLIHNRFNNPH